MAETTPNSSAPPPATYSDAPPEEERSSSSYLILAVNVVILALALWWVIHRAQQGTGAQPNAMAGTGGGVAAPDGTGGGDGTAMQPVAGGDWRKGVGADDAFGGRGGETPEPVTPGRVTPTGRRILLPRPNFDALTASQFADVEAGISALGPSIEVVRTIRSVYPTSKDNAFGDNRGIEALVELLAARGVLERLSVPLGDTDGDGRKEMIDPWGRPLVYFSHDDYGTTQEVTGVGTVGSRERWVEDVRSWQGEQRFQLFSVGPNGKDDWGGYDDCNSWVTKQ